MTTTFSVTDIELELARYPKDQESNLQAWDAADEHLIKHLKETEQEPVITAIINDNFGALTTSLRAIDAAWPLMVETDAKTSQLGILQNLAANKLSREGIAWLNSREALPSKIELVLMKLPKNLTYFSHQLSRLSQVLPKDTQVLISAKAKSISQSVLELIGKHLGPASASLTWKKTRVITCISDGKVRNLPNETQWSVPSLNLEIRNLSNVFAANKLDIGAEIMLENMPKGNFKSIIDLGCGNGILGLHAKQLFPEAYIHFVDDSEMAIESAKQNWKLNNLNTDGLVGEQASFGWDDCLTHLNEGVRPDLILCNPPFHQGEAITDHIAWQMFLQSWRSLKNGGILHVVGNRHLAYHVKLQRIFKNCTTVASNGKFVILQAQKISKKAEPFDNATSESETKTNDMTADSQPIELHPQSGLYGTKK